MAKELLHRRTKHSKHFDNEDGTLTAVFEQNLHYQDVDGYKDVDTALKSSGNGHVLEESDFRATVTKQGSTTLLQVTERDTGMGVVFSVPGNPTITERGLRFSRGGDVWEYGITKTGLKLFAEVGTRRGSKTFQFPYQLVGGASDLNYEDGDLVCYDGDRRVFIIPQAFVDGADGEVYYCDQWVVTDTTLTFTWNDTALPDEAFPYTIDPTTMFSISVGTQDVQVWKTGTTYPPTSSTSANNVITTVRASRWFNGTDHIIENALFKWDTSSLPDNVVITGASYRAIKRLFGNPDVRNLTADWHVFGTPASDSYSENSLTGAIDIPLADINNTVIPLNTEFTIPLSSAAANVSKTGFTGLRFHVSGGEATAANYFSVASFNNTDGYDPPQLIVNYYLVGEYQRLAPDALLLQTNLTGAVTTIQDDPDSPDGNWLVAP